MDFSEALAAVQGWIGKEVAAGASLPHGPSYVQACGVIGQPGCLWTEDEGMTEFWLFPLDGGGGAFSLQRAAFVDTFWEDGRLRDRLMSGQLTLELA